MPSGDGNGPGQEPDRTVGTSGEMQAPREVAAIDPEGEARIAANERYVAIRNEIAQRSSFQHAYLVLSVVATGSVLAFGLGETREALLIIPYLSFTLFLLWVHQAFAIMHIGRYMREELRDPWESYPVISVLVGLPLFVALTSCFAVSGVIGLLLFQAAEGPSDSVDGLWAERWEQGIYWGGWFLIGMVVLGILVWAVAYHRRSD